MRGRAEGETTGRDDGDRTDRKTGRRVASPVPSSVSLPAPGDRLQAAWKSFYNGGPGTFLPA